MSFVSPRNNELRVKRKQNLLFLEGPVEQGCQLTTSLQNFLSKELMSVLLSSWKLSSRFWSLQKSLNVLTALSVALLVDLERLSCRSCSISSSSVLV